MKILLTAFDPFGGASVNPAWEAVSRVREDLPGIVLRKLLVPTVFAESGALVNRTANEWGAGAVICVGQAGGRYEVTPERVAINIDDASVPDNAGDQPVDRPITPGGAPAYFATLPNKAIVAALRRAGIPSSLSDSAGTYVCNHLLYQVLEENALRHPERLGGFLHLPFLPAQVVNRSRTPSMALGDMVRALEIALAVTSAV